MSIAAWKRQPRLATVLLGKLKEDQLPSDALKLLRNMRLVRMENNVFHYTATISACGECFAWDSALSFLQVMADSQAWHRETDSQGPYACHVRCRQWKFAGGLLSLTSQEDVITLSAVLSAFQKADQWESAFTQLGMMLLGQVQPNTFSLNSVISSCDGSWQQPLSMLATPRFQELNDEISYNSVMMSICEEVPQWTKALELLRCMKHGGLRPDEVSYGAMLSTFERTKQWQMALQMAGHASFVDSISWTSVMTGTTWQVALLLLYEALEQGTVDNLCYGAVLESCAVASRWQITLQLLQWSRDDVVCLAATLVACHGAMKFMESSKLMGEMSLLATSELACCEKICACLRCMGARGARGCLDPTDGAKDLSQIIDSLAALLNKLCKIKMWNYDSCKNNIPVLKRSGRLRS
eukprot:symbB.v1.2.015495.t1/scaffold1160.1/size134679/4